MQTGSLFEDTLDEIQFDQGGSETAVRFDEIIDDINNP